jgi:serine/threonine protein kinase/Tol biopolymer transport system component
MTITAGSRLGPYEILAPLGAGGMGEVYRARDARLGREVAVKVLPAEVAGDASRLKRFEKEARSASALNHPNIVTIYEIGSSDAISWIAMERVDGKTLRELLFGGALPIKKLLPIAAQIADGLARAHEAGIVHRDLKPENVMVTKEGLVKILDFGLAKQTAIGSGSDEGSHMPTETGTSPGVVLGTVGYMSPEQAAGQPVDFRSDQFSFGSILYEMTTGKRAFQRKTGVDTLAAILNEDPPPIATFNPDVPTPLRWIAERCLAKDPEGRYASTKDLARELATVRDRLSEAGGSDASIARPRRRSVLLPLAVLASLAAGAILTLLTVRPLRREAQPDFRQLTFGSGTIQTPRFAPDGQTVVFGYQRQGGKQEILTARAGGTESRSLGLPPGNVLSVSRSGEIAVLLGDRFERGTLARVPLAGGAPREILENVSGADWSPDGTGFVVIHSVGDVKRVEYPIGHVLYETHQGLRNVRFSPRGDLIAIYDSRPIDASGPLLLLDPKGSNKPRPFGTASGLFAWSPTGEELWFSEDDRGVTTVSALSLSGRKRRVVSLPGQFFLHDVSREGTLLMERNAWDPAMFGLLPGDADERDLTWLDGPVPADISADGRFVLFTETGAGGGPARSVYLWKAQDGNAVRLGDGTALALSPDGRWALATGDSPTRLRLLPTGAGEPRFLDLSDVRTGGSGNAGFPTSGTFFPDSKRVLVTGFEGTGGKRLFVVDLDGGKPRPIGPEGAFFTDGAHGVSPDGRSIAAFGPDHITRLFPADGGPEARGTPIPGAAEGEEAIQWCADGRCVFVGGNGPSGDGIYRLDIQTGRRVLWKSEKSFKNAGPNFNYSLPTPDGRWYVYGFYRIRSNLFLVDGVK